MDKTKREFMIELWVARMLSSTQFERGFYQGRFEEFARQNAISSSEFVFLQEAAREKTIARLERVPVEVDEWLLSSDLPGSLQ